MSNRNGFRPSNVMCFWHTHTQRKHERSQFVFNIKKHDDFHGIYRIVSALPPPSSSSVVDEIFSFDRTLPGHVCLWLLFTFTGLTRTAALSCTEGLFGQHSPFSFRSRLIYMSEIYQQICRRGVFVLIGIISSKYMDAGNTARASFEFSVNIYIWDLCIRLMEIRRTY